MNLPVRITILLLCLLQLFAFSSLQGAPAIAQPTDTQWQRLTNDKAFGYKTQKEVQEPERNTNADAFNKGILALLYFFNSTIGRVLLWTLFLAFAGWVLYRFFFGSGITFWNKTAKKLNEEETIIEPGLFDADWEKELQLALKDNNMRLAIRYSYMRLLQIMEERGIIQYRADKTNYEYYHEIAEPYKQPFKQLTRQYENVWYGDLPISGGSYNTYMDTFHTLKHTINS